MHVDGPAVPAGLTLRFDICIVGAGPAGIAMARRLSGHGLRIALIESGGFRQTVRTQRLNHAAVIGRPYWPMQSSRFRVFGGSATRWGGMCRPLDPFDLQVRDWVAGSGWPIPYSEMQRYHADAAEVLGLTRPDFDAGAWRGDVHPPSDWPGPDFEDVVFQFSPTKMSFGDTFKRALVGAQDVVVITEATVTDLQLAPGSDRVERAVVKTFAGQQFSVFAATFVLAAGAIENARVLLACRTDRPAGLGNENDLVGRYFMEHVHVETGHLVRSAKGSDLGFFEFHDLPGGALVRGAIAATPAAQESGRLLAASLFVEPPVHAAGQPFMTWPPEVTVFPERALRHLLARTGRTAPSAEPTAVDPSSGSHAHPLRDLVGQVWYGATSFKARRTLARIRADGVGDAEIHALYMRAEQVPNPASRVSLDSRRDALGMPEARFDWRLTDQDLANVQAWMRRFADHVEKAGLGTYLPMPEDWTEHIIGGPHHMGTTRMSADPKHGVVDANSRVHSVANLYVAGGSVFTTGGYANPTFALLALSLRLADHLADAMTTPATIAVAQTD